MDTSDDFESRPGDEEVTSELRAAPAYAPPVVAPPPRNVPLSLWLHAYCGGLSQLGWLFFGFGMIFYWVFVGAADLESLFYFRGTLETAKGHVTEAVETSYSEGGGKGRKGTPIWANHFEFDYRGQTYRDVSYAVGRGLKFGDRVTVEFPAGDPVHARILGMRCKPFSAWVMFVTIFPLVGMAFIAAGIRRGRKAVRLLRDGLLAPATMVKQERTNSSVNNRPVFKLHFEFTADDGQVYHATYRSHEPERFTDSHEPLMYHPLNPEYALPLDAVPGRAEFDESGFLRPRNGFATIWILILPALSIFAHGTVFLVKVLSAL